MRSLAADILARANAKAHKKQIDKLTARLGQVTQQRDDAAAQLMVKEQEAAFFRAEFERLRDVMPEAKPKNSDRTKWSTLLLSAGFVYLSGFLLTLGFFSAAGWVELIGGLVR